VLSKSKISIVLSVFSLITLVVYTEAAVLY
jgi:hypothetical protein